MLLLARTKTIAMIIAYMFFLLNIPFATSLSFNIANFAPSNRNITYEGSATARSGAIQLTTSTGQQTTGRATYFQSLYLWNQTSGNVTDFSTNFTFSIDTAGRSVYRGGLAFFLAQDGTTIPTTSSISQGGTLGLPDGSTQNPFVAVEIDIDIDEWDPPAEHIGIDVNSMVSVANQTWDSAVDSITGGRTLEARIDYDSTTGNLSMSLFNFSANNLAYRVQSVSYLVNMSLVLPEYVTFGFSAASGSFVTIFNIYSWSFSSTLELDAKSTDGAGEVPPAPIAAPPIAISSAKSKSGLVIGLAVVGILVTLGSGLALYFFLNRNNGCMSLGVSVPKKLEYDVLYRATNKFKEVIGKGGFGSVYKGHIQESNLLIAVKKMSEESWQGMKEFTAEVTIISSLKHMNLVELIGWCHEKKELLIVYEFMPNGSLDYHLYGKRILDWDTRFKIAKGLASALLYIHEERKKYVVHSDIKSSNVMLDQEFNAKLGDFGLARQVKQGIELRSTLLAGTVGYMAPECVGGEKASKESDVFSFDVVALEIACGKTPLYPDPHDEKTILNLVKEVWKLYGLNKILDVADPRLHGEFNSEEMKKLMIVGLWCANPFISERPSIKQVVRVLDNEAPLPNDIPPSMPVLGFIPTEIFTTAPESQDEEALLHQNKFAFKF